jgi:sugar lactone lactonase YvrE
VFAAAVLAGGIAPNPVRAQSVEPTNDAPNPYRTVTGWAKLPEGRHWGSTSAVDIDRDGKSIWVGERCGANSCVDPETHEIKPIPTILKFDPSGDLVKSFGAGVLTFAHGIYVDKDDNIWVTDGQDNGYSGHPATKGHQVFKFSPEGKLLMTLGKPGGGTGDEYFFQPDDVIVAPNGDIFVSEGHGGPSNRLYKFTKDGKLIQTFGKKGTGTGEFDIPHALAFDSRGRLYVGDRNNNRIQIFDQNFKYLGEMKQFSRPSGIFIDRNDTIYVADSESESVSKNHDGWKRGIRIGSLKDGKVTAFIPDPVAVAKGTSAAEGVAVDAAGNVYGAEVGPRDLKKYMKQ